MPDFKTLMLYYFCSLAGFVMVAGGIVLLYKQKIYIDKESNQITEIETPVGKFKTNLPALLLFALGFIPLVYPIRQLKICTDKVTIVGNAIAPTQMRAFVFADDGDLLPGEHPFSLVVPKGGTYTLLFVARDAAGDHIFPGPRVPSLDTAKNGEVTIDHPLEFPSLPETPLYASGEGVPGR